MTHFQYPPRIYIRTLDDAFSISSKDLYEDTHYQYPPRIYIRTLVDVFSGIIVL